MIRVDAGRHAQRRSPAGKRAPTARARIRRATRSAGAASDGRSVRLRARSSAPRRDGACRRRSVKRLRRASGIRIDQVDDHVVHDRPVARSDFNRLHPFVFGEIRRHLEVLVLDGAAGRNRIVLVHRPDGVGLHRSASRPRTRAAWACRRGCLPARRRSPTSRSCRDPGRSGADR